MPLTPVRSQSVGAAVLALPERCYRCGTFTRSIVGFLVAGHYPDDPDGFVDFELLARLFARRVTAAQLAQCGIGPIKMRRSRYRPYEKPEEVTRPKLLGTKPKAMPVNGAKTRSRHDRAATNPRLEKHIPASAAVSLAAGVGT